MTKTRPVENQGQFPREINIGPGDFGHLSCSAQEPSKNILRPRNLRCNMNDTLAQVIDGGNQ